jgi:NCS1 family nucleobase:cation symporter-1
VLVVFLASADVAAFSWFIGAGIAFALYLGLKSQIPVHAPATVPAASPES